MHQIRLDWGSALTPLEELVGFQGPTSKDGDGKGKERGNKGQEKREEEEEREKLGRKARSLPYQNQIVSAPLTLSRAKCQRQRINGMLRIQVLAILPFLSLTKFH